MGKIGWNWVKSGEIRASANIHSPDAETMIWHLSLKLNEISEWRGFYPTQLNWPRGKNLSFWFKKRKKKVKDTLVIKFLSGLRGLLTSITPNLTVTLPSNRSSSLYTSSTLNIILEHHKINFNFITELFWFYAEIWRDSTR